VLALETRLAKASLTKVELRDPQASYHLSDLAGLQKLTKATPWPAYFSGGFDAAGADQYCSS
jgi:putative endopeptidase